VTDADGRRAFARHLAALDAQQTADALGNLSRLTVPTQLVWGRGDVFQTWDGIGEALRAVLPDPEVVLLDAGHFSPLEAPEAFGQALVSWQPTVPDP
jgi:pimeloyl-ACP methyl ester carboxylesterase